MIISPSAFTVMKPKSKKYELTEEIVSLRKPFSAAFNSFAVNSTLMLSDAIPKCDCQSL